MNAYTSLVILVALLSLCDCRTVGERKAGPALAKLLAKQREEPPQFMVELYQRASSHDLDAKAINPYNASVVRSVKGIDQSDGITRFNLDVLKEEILLGAELHIYAGENEMSTEQVSIKAITKAGKVIVYNEDGLYGPGWTVIDVHDFVDKRNKDFVMETVKVKPEAKVYLVVYSDVQKKEEEATIKRSKRQAPAAAGSCDRIDMEVDFEKIGWTSWIISPKGYNAYRCAGACKFPIGEEFRPTNHATIQSIVSQLPEQRSVPAPCCTPAKLLPLTMLFYDENDNVVLKQYDDMIVEYCGCQ